MNRTQLSALTDFIVSLEPDEKIALRAALAPGAERKPAYRCPGPSAANTLAAEGECKEMKPEVAAIVRERICCVLEAKNQGRKFYELGIGQVTLWRWMHTYETYGSSGLIPRKSTGRPKKA